jgi:hypothetical protein
VDWGIKMVQGDKNTNSLIKVEELIAQYQSGMLGATRHQRFQTIETNKGIVPKIVELAETHKLSVKLFSRDRVHRAYFTFGLGTKQEIAEIIAKRFPDELGTRLPLKSKAWMSEQYQMSIFDAVALAVLLPLNKVK